MVMQIKLVVVVVFFSGHRSLIRNNTETAVINMAIKRMLKKHNLCVAIRVLVLYFINITEVDIVFNVKI